MMSFEVPFEALGLMLVHFCWQGAVIAGAARLAGLAAPGLKPGTRYTVHLMALIAMALTAVTTFGWEWARLAAHDPMPADVLSVAHVSAASGVAFKDVLPWLDTVWALGVIALSLRMMGGLWLIHRLSAGAQPVPAVLEARFIQAVRALGLRSVRLRMHPGIDGPFVVGIVRSIVYLPVSAVSALSPDQLDAVLAHELEHIRRADFAWNLLQTAIETLFFYHPAVWWLGKTLRDQRELACDDAAVTLCRDPLTYATALLALEERRPARKLSPSLAMALGGKDGSLLTRIRRVLGEGHNGRPMPVRPALVAAPLVVAVLAALAVPVSQVAAHGTETAKKQCRIKAAESIGGTEIDTRDLKMVEATADDHQTSDAADSDESPAAEATDSDVEPKDFWSGLMPKPLDESRLETFKFKGGKFKADKMAQTWKIKMKDGAFDSDTWKLKSQAIAEQARASIDVNEIHRARAEGLREGAEEARRQAEAMADQNSAQARGLRQAAERLARQAQALRAEIPTAPDAADLPVPPEAPAAPEAPEAPEAALPPAPPAPPAAPARPARPLADAHIRTPSVRTPEAAGVRFDMLRITPAVPAPGEHRVMERVIPQQPIVVALNRLPDAHAMAIPSPDPAADVVVQTHSAIKAQVRIRILSDGGS